MRLSRKWIYYIASLAACLIFGGYILLYTQLGLNFSFALAKRFIPGNFSAETVSGQLGQRFVMTKFSFTNKDVRVTADRILFTWNPFLMLNNIMDIQYVEINKLRVINFNRPNRTTPSNLDWLKNINLAQLYITEFSYSHADKFTIPINEIRLLKTNKVNQISLLFPQGIVDGTYTLLWNPDLSWKINLSGHNIHTNDPKQNTYSDINFNLNSNGTWGDKDKTVNFLLSNLNGKIKNRPVTGDIDLSFHNKDIVFRKFNLLFSDATIAIYGTVKKQWNLLWNINIPQLHTIFPNYYGNITSSGKVISINNLPQANGSISLNNIKIEKIRLGQVTGNITSNLRKQGLADLNLTLKNTRVSEYLIPFIKVNATANIVEQQLDLLLNLSTGLHNAVSGVISLPQFLAQSDATQKLVGKLNINFTNINQFVSSPYLKNIQGRLAGIVNINGTLLEPIYTGNLALAQGMATIPRLGILLKNVHIKSIFNQDKLFNLNGSFSSGAGSATFKGDINLSKIGYPFNVHLIGNNLQVANLDQYKITASPNLIFTYADNVSDIKGKIFLPYVRIVTKDESNIVTLPSDVTFVGEKPGIDYFSRYSMQIQLILGEKIYVAAKKLRAKLAGSIYMSQIPGGLPTGSGELLITKGAYRVYNNLFVIRDGRLIYTGNILTNPGLSIRAMQKIGPATTSIFGVQLGDRSNSTGTVGVLVRGTLNNQIITLISDPPMSQDDILSQMVFGQDSSTLNAASALPLLGALTSNMNLTSANSTDGGTEPSDGGGGLFKMGLFNPAQVLNFKHTISKHFSIQTEASITETAADILYVTESAH